MAAGREEVTRPHGRMPYLAWPSVVEHRIAGSPWQSTSSALARAMSKGGRPMRLRSSATRANALADLKQCAGEIADGRAPATEAAWHSGAGRYGMD